MEKREQVIKDLEEVIGYIKSDDLADEAKKKITDDTINYFNNYVYKI